MNKTKINEAKDIISFKGGIIRTSEAIKAGIYSRTLYQMRDRGELDELSRGVYVLPDSCDYENPDLVIIAKRIPNAVLTLVSALSFHDLTTQIPSEISIALPKGIKPPKIDYPNIKVHNFSEISYNLGIEKHVKDCVSIKVYDAEKTIVDCFRFRNKLGMEIVLEALKFYKSRKKQNWNKIMDYAEKTRIQSKIFPYLEAML